MLFRVIGKSLLGRKKELLITTSAVLLAAALVAALTTLSMEIGSKAGKELEAYGPNLLLTPEAVSLPAGVGSFSLAQVTNQGYIPAQQTLDLLDSGRIGGITGYAPYLYTLARVGSERVVVVGTLLEKLRLVAPYWQLEGRGWVTDEADRYAVVGQQVARRLLLRPGEKLSLKFRNGTQSFEVAAIAKVGGSEDNQVFITLKIAQSMSGRLGQLDLVQIRAATEKSSVSETAAKFEQAVPGVRATMVRQLATAERSVLFKVQLLMAFVTALVLLATTVAVFSTMTGSVLQRTKEIGLMKALGAQNKQVALIFIAEAWASGAAGGFFGSALGLGLGQAVAKSVFSTYLAPQPTALLVTLLISLVVTTAASLGPVRRALSVNPIAALRGE